MTEKHIPPGPEQKTKNYNENCKCSTCSLIRRCK